MKVHVFPSSVPGTRAICIEVADDIPDPAAPAFALSLVDFKAWSDAQPPLELPAPVPETVPMHKLLKAAYRLHGITLAQIQAEIAALQDAAVKYEAECDLRAPFVRRTAGLIGWLGTRLGKSSAQIDDLFRYVDTID